jgi:hypothetical protein
MHDDQTQQPAATALRPMRPTEILGTAFGLHRRHWRTLLAIVAAAVPVTVSLPSSKAVSPQGGKFAVSVPALVVEGRRARDALARSWNLVAGLWWHTFGTILLTWLLLGLAVNLVSNAVGGFGRGWLARTVAQGLSMTLATPFAALIGVLLYLDLRARKELLDADVLRRDLRASGTQPTAR